MSRLARLLRNYRSEERSDAAADAAGRHGGADGVFPPDENERRPMTVKTMGAMQRHAWRRQIARWLGELETRHGPVRYRQKVGATFYDLFADGTLAVYEDPYQARSDPHRTVYPRSRPIPHDAPLLAFPRGWN